MDQRQFGREKAIDDISWTDEFVIKMVIPADLTRREMPIIECMMGMYSCGVECQGLGLILRKMYIFVHEKRKDDRL